MNSEQKQEDTPMGWFLQTAATAHARRRLFLLLATVLCGSQFLVPCSLAQADSPPHIEKVQIGLPAGQGEQETVRSRAGAWTPVYVKLKSGPDGNGRDRFKVRVETTDAENTQYHYETSLPALVANEDYIAVSYIRPGSAGSDFTVSLLAADGQTVSGEPAVTVEGDKDMLDPNDVLYVTVGARPTDGMKRALLADPAQPNAPDADLVDRKGMVRLAHIDDIEHMPDRWFGYEAADVVVFTTPDSFVKSLLDDPAAPQRRKALAEWVRHGGKLIVSVGANRQLAAEVLDKMPLPDADRMPLIDCRIDGTAACPETANLSHWMAGSDGRVALPLHDVELTRLVPGAGVTVLVSESAKTADGMRECPVVVEAGCGLGRVWLTAFDLDAAPFAASPEGQKAFWNKVQSEFTPKATARPNPAPQMGPGWQPPGGDENGEPPALLVEMQRSLENFEGVPVVNFGWVALFILIYIVIVGPLDYILLTRVFKRPELTWVTFPVVILSLSVLVYVVAYTMKGDDLRIKKIDLVEYDLNSPQQAYGTTWFTLFSPRIQNYTLSLEPSAPGWAASPPADAIAHPVVVSGLANPDASERAGSSSLFRKPYAYAEDAHGMEGVPIPVWSTRSFQASWRAGVDSAKPPIAAHLSRGVEEKALLAGEITNQLPAPLQSVTIFYRGNYYSAPDLAPGQAYDIAGLWEKGKTGRPAVQWFNNAQVLAPPYDPSQGPAMPGRQPYDLMKDLMFHAKADGSTMNNSGLRPLDQSWRLTPRRAVAPGRSEDRSRDEIILVARTPILSDRAETVAQDPACSTRIWLDRLPDGKAKPPALTGYLRQETYVRAYIPVSPSKDKADQP